ncbi:hypothetical protein OTU49_009328 [Cherax quadricarinatus]|uniref:Uncharacterized protein n=1 Tax=Cherax quadricarinatus TaxID=27406 RepID=A0AAW0WBG7_CHEQU
MGSEQHYSLRWNDYTVKIVTAFQSLRDEEDFVDVTVACDGHSYSAHKMVLSACSPYFRALLRANPCQHPIVILKDVGHVELERLLEFMYNGEVSIAQDQLAAFLKTAENLKIRGLAGSSDDMDQTGLHRPDVSYSYSSGSAIGGVTSGRSSPSAGYAPSQGSKDEEIIAEGSGSYHSRPESPPSKRRKRTSAPAAGHADSNTASHTTEGVIGDNPVEVDTGGTMSGGSVPGEDDIRLDRREMKSEPGDSMADVYSESSEMSTDPQSHTGEGMDPRQALLYPIAMPGPSGAVGSQDNVGTHEPGERKIVAGWEPHPSHCTCESCRSCGFCGKAFSTVGSRKRHERDKHVDPGSLPCEVCGKWCKNRGALIKHKSMLHRPLLPTDIRYDTHPALLLAAHSAAHHHSFSTHHTTPLPPTTPVTSTTTSPLPPISVTAIGESSEGESALGAVGGDIQRAYQQFM